MQERRKFVRINEQAAVTYNIMPDYKSGKKMVIDLSLGGIRFVSDYFIPLHSIIKVQIKLKHIPKVINAIVKSVWIKEIFDDETYEVGAAIIEIDRADLKFMHSYLNRESS